MNLLILQKILELLFHKERQYSFELLKSMKAQAKYPSMQQWNHLEQQF